MTRTWKGYEPRTAEQWKAELAELGLPVDAKTIAECERSRLEAIAELEAYQVVVDEMVAEEGPGVLRDRMDPKKSGLQCYAPDVIKKRKDGRIDVKLDIGL